MSPTQRHASDAMTAAKDVMINCDHNALILIVHVLSWTRETIFKQIFSFIRTYTQKETKICYINIIHFI